MKKVYIVIVIVLVICGLFLLIVVAPFSRSVRKATKKASVIRVYRESDVILPEKPKSLSFKLPSTIEVDSAAIRQSIPAESIFMQTNVEPTVPTNKIGIPAFYRGTSSKSKSLEVPVETLKEIDSEINRTVDELIDFLTIGSRSAYQTRVKANELSDKASNIRVKASTFSNKNIREQMIKRADFLDSLSVELARTRGTKTKMRRLATRLQNPFYSPR